MVRYLNGGLKTGQKKACLWSEMSGIFEWSAKSHDLTIWIQDAHSAPYTDETGIWMFRIQMVTVVGFQDLIQLGGKVPGSSW